MIRSTLSKSEIEARYPTGTRIRLIHMEGEERMPCGLLGTVKKVDDVGTIHMSWDNGSGLGLVLDADMFEKIS